MSHVDRNIAGDLIFLGATQVILGIHIAEALYPGYSVSINFLSDLGATCRATCVVEQPSATIFNSSIFMLGFLVMVASYFLQRAFGKTFVTALSIVTGIGAMGVGIFPETARVLHQIASVVVFLFGALFAVSAYSITEGRLRYFSLGFGLTSLGALALYLYGYSSGDDTFFLGLGAGGMERTVAYPTLLWAIGFGGHLSARTKAST